MNIVYYLLEKFFNEEKVNVGIMVIVSFIINMFQTNGISYMTANIINSLNKNDKPNVLYFFKFFMAISVIYILLYGLYKFFQNKLLTKLRQWMRHELVKMLLMVNNENFSEINFTKLSSPINRISSVSFMVFNDLITFILPNITFLLIISCYFLYKNALFGLLFILGNIAVFLYLCLKWNSMLIYNEEYEKYVGDNESYLVEILNNIDKIIFRGQTEKEIDVFEKKTNRSIEKAFQFYATTNFHGGIMNLGVFALIFSCIGYLIYLYFHKKIEVTTFIAFFTILLLYRDKMTTMIQQIPDFIEFLGRSDAVLKHFNNMADSIEKINNTTYKPVDLPFRNIKFENVSYQYSSSKKPVFENLDLTLETHDKIIGIIGLSGNGKSTIMKLLLKLYRPTSGTIYIDGEKIDNIDSDYIRKHVTYVNQSSKLFDKKIIDNMMYGCSDKEVCANHLEEIMQYQKIKELYRNMDIRNKKSGALGEGLSGGQRQVVNIIGGLINPSKILILDEPTNALDPELKTEILGLIQEYKKHKQCIIIITHDRDAYSLFDETIQI